MTVYLQGVPWENFVKHVGKLHGVSLEELQYANENPQQYVNRKISTPPSDNEPEPEPELEWKPQPEVQYVADGMRRRHTDPMLQPQNVSAGSVFHSERQRCMQMLKVLADTLDDEYVDGGRAHWGSEDR